MVGAEAPPKAGVIGHPVTHSLSPILHTRWLRNHGIDGTFVRLDGEEYGGFSRFITGRLGDYRGVCVTLPYKNKALSACHRPTERAREVGAVNLLYWDGADLVGDNTDALGFLAALEETGAPADGARARLFGAGGAAPAVAWALRQAGVTELEICNRTHEKATSLADRFSGIPVPWFSGIDSLAGVDIVVNATSLGLPGSAPFELPLEGLPAHALVADIIPAAGTTALLARAQRLGLSCMDGLPMLVHQAVPAFEAFFGVRPTDTAAALAALRDHIG